MTKKIISIKRFLEQFNKEYEFLYSNRDNVAGAEEALEEFDNWAPKNKEFVQKFVEYRGDFISSDREATAFMFALESILEGEF